MFFFVARPVRATGRLPTRLAATSLRMVSSWTIRSSPAPRYWVRVPKTNAGSICPARSMASMSARSFRRLKKALNTARSLHPRKGSPDLVSFCPIPRPVGTGMGPVGTDPVPSEMVRVAGAVEARRRGQPGHEQEEGPGGGGPQPETDGQDEGPEARGAEGDPDQGRHQQPPRGPTALGGPCRLEDIVDGTVQVVTGGGRQRSGSRVRSLAGDATPAVGGVVAPRSGLTPPDDPTW